MIYGYVLQSEADLSLYIGINFDFEPFGHLRRGGFPPHSSRGRCCPSLNRLLARRNIDWRGKSLGQVGPGHGEGSLPQLFFEARCRQLKGFSASDETFTKRL